MQNTAKVMAIYRELRTSVGTNATPAEVLACAASLVELFAVEEGMPNYDLRDSRQPYDMLPVDVAMADGGWRTLSYEWTRMGMESSYGCGGSRSRSVQWGF